MSSTLESILSKDTINGINEWIKKLQKSTLDLWDTSRYFRIISIATTSITTSLVARRLYVKYYRQYKDLPNGPVGWPIFGEIYALFNPEQWQYVAPISKYGPVATVQLFAMSCIIISNPFLVKEIYSDSRALDNPTTFVDTDLLLTTANGKSWAKRRKIIFANIMSTMKATFVEDSTKHFVKNKLFPICDENIQNDKNNDMKKLFRCIGFNVVLHACFGKELDSINDPFWSQYEHQLTESRKHQQLLLSMLFLPKSIQKQLQTLLGLKSFEESFDASTKIIEEFAVNDTHKVPVKYDKNVKLYNEYIEQYLNDDDDDDVKLTKRHLLGDMSIMIQASTDTSYAGLAFAVLESAKNPEIQEEIYEELNNAFDGDIDNIRLSNDGIFKIPKLRAFIHEVLRIHPPAAIAGFRQINVDDFKIDTRKYGGNRVYNVPKGVNLLMNVQSISREPKWWIKKYDPIKHKDVDMEKINFQFWIDENGKFNKKNNSDLFLIFSRGKRDCIGQSLAMKVLYITLAMIFLKYKIFGPNGNGNFHIKFTQTEGITILPATIKMELR